MTDNEQCCICRKPPYERDMRMRMTVCRCCDETERQLKRKSIDAVKKERGDAS